MGMGHIGRIHFSHQAANSPFGNDLILPRPWEETGYVHNTLRVNTAQ